jgi:hypothetical protein
MAVAKNEPIYVKNYDQIWSEYFNPELDMVWTGKARRRRGDETGRRANPLFRPASGQLVIVH